MINMLYCWLIYWNYILSDSSSLEKILINPLDSLNKPECEFEDNKCTTNKDNVNYYPINEQDVLRESIIGGGDMLSGGDPNVYN